MPDRIAMKDGVIKFNLQWHEDRAPENVDDLLLWKDKLCEAALIGMHADGTSYGNISARSGREFVISGSGTGRHTTSRREHFTRVTDYDFEANTITCRGPVEASSESLTHAAIYEADPTVAAVAHIHHKRLWKDLLGTVPTTSAEIAYGTPEMAYEIFRLFRQTEVASDKLFVMGGHEDGIVSFGGTLADVGRRLLGLLQREHRN